MIVAEVFHPSLTHKPLDYGRTLQFVIDTGAEKTLIVPYYEELLGIPDDELVPDPEPINTIGGEVRLVCLPNCCLVLNNMQHRPYVVGRLSIYFFAPQEKMKKKPPLMGEPDFPCIFGRDVLDQLSLGYCQTSDYLFVTKQTDKYRDKLQEEFPPPEINHWGRSG